MNWSRYSRYVGDIFGAPLAMEGLIAFFLESTFLGLWIFGWDRLSRRIHLAAIWLVAFGTVLSAAFIMAANSWMQHPVGYTITVRAAELNNIWAVFTNPVFLWGYLHIILASLVTARGDARRLGLAAASAAARSERVRRTRPRLLARLADLLVGDHPGARRQRAGRHRSQVPADEDRGGRGAVDHLPAMLVLPAPDRRRQRRPDARPDHPDPAPALAAGHQLVERQGHRAQPAAGPVREEVRARRLRPQRLHPVLVDAGDGLRRRAGAAARAVGALADAAQDIRRVRAGSCSPPSGP